jgi:hypothetical protein
MYFEDVELVHRNDIGTDMFDHGMFDLLGERFGRLRIIGQDFFPETAPRYELQCRCGISIWRTIDELHESRVESCGFCLPVRLREKRGRTKRERIMGILKGAIQRCHNPNTDNYRYYGARGVTVYQGWRDDPESFYHWSLANGYEDNLTLDRRDNYSGGYSPTNCRWVNMEVNLQNMRRHQDARGGAPA